MSGKPQVPSHIKTSNTLLLTKVPANANDVYTLFKHFKKHGRIKGIWCNNTTAMISFEKEEDAKKAFESPEAYANNRFVRFLYHQDEEHAETRLSSIADMTAVDNALEEIKNEVRAAEEKLAKASEDMEKEALIKEIKDHEAKLMEEIEELENKIKAAPESEKSDLNAKLDGLKRELEEVRSLLL